MKYTFYRLRFSDFCMIKFRSLKPYMELKNKRCLIMGFGKEGRACLSYLESCGVNTIGVSDQSNIEELKEQYPSVSLWHLGDTWNQSIDLYDVIFKSPGIPSRYVRDFTGAVVSATAIFLEACRDKTIAITGTKGKSTSVTLLHHLFQALGVNSVLGGNIGVPPLDMLHVDADVFVLELSSYQLEMLQVSPRIGVILNIFQDHLDHHGSLEKYQKAKLQIGKFQEEGDTIILPWGKNEELAEFLPQESDKRLFGGSDAFAFIENDVLCLRPEGSSPFPLILTVDLPYKGKGMIQNTCAVLECLDVAFQSGLIASPDWSKVCEALKSYQPLPHRMQEVRAANGTLFINDSISTVPEASIHALEVYEDSIETLILGGFDRSISYTALLEYVPHTKVKTVIFIPPAGERMYEEIKGKFQEKYRNITLYLSDSFPDIVNAAGKSTTRNGVCLFSPAAPSFGMFRNFEERGEVFMELVRKVPST
jgi:UDP-N-acetylmuramoyl-L-alanine---L-glutamate ligase